MPRALTAAKVNCAEMAKIDSGLPVNLSVSSQLHECFCVNLPSQLFSHRWLPLILIGHGKKQYPLPLATVACLPADATALDGIHFKCSGKCYTRCQLGVTPAG